MHSTGCVTQAMDKLLLKPEEAAEQIGVSRTHFYKLHSSGELGPLPIKLGECSRWSYAELQRWVELGCPSREQWVRMIEKEMSMSGA
jgi:excisionase family DNA binding protein